MQTVVCMRWGDRFPVDYVNRLYRGVMRNVARPTRFIAFTDDASGLDSGIEPREIPPIRLPATGLGGSPWRKLALWSPEIGLEGDLLFLDLDVVVVGSLDAFFDHEPGKLAIIRDWSAREFRQFLGHAPAGRGRAASGEPLRGRPLGQAAAVFERAGLSLPRIRPAARLLAARMGAGVQSHDAAPFPPQSVS